MPTKGLKSQRGRPEVYDEVKKRMSVSLTPTGAKQLDDLAKSFGLSRGELVERIGRSLILVASVEPEGLEKLKAIANSQELNLTELTGRAIQTFIETYQNPKADLSKSKARSKRSDIKTGRKKSSN